MKKAIILILLIFGTQNINIVDAQQALVANGNYIFAAIANSLMCSSDTGNTWSFVNNGLSHSVNALAISDSNIFAGTSQGGVFRSLNNGQLWTAVNNGLTYAYNGTDARTILSLAISGRNIFAGARGGGIFLSTNNGNSWVAINEGIERDKAVGLPFVNSILVSGNYIFAGTFGGSGGGVYRSTNNGQLWTSVNNGSINHLVQCLAISGNKIFAGTIRGIFVSDDNGNTWSEANNGLNEPDYTGVFSFAGKGSNIFAGTVKGVLISSNTNIKWSPLNNGLTYIYQGYPDHGATYTCSVKSLLMIGGYIFAGTDEGLFRSIDNGNTWEKKY